MTHPPDAQLADSIGNGIFFAILIAFNVWTRFKQGKHLEASVDQSLQTRVASLEAALKTTQDLVAIYTDNVKESNALSKDLKVGINHHLGEIQSHRMEMHGFKTTIEKGEVLAAQINDYLARAKAGKLQTEPPVTGSVAFKEEKNRK